MERMTGRWEGIEERMEKEWSETCFMVMKNLWTQDVLSFGSFLIICSIAGNSMIRTVSPIRRFPETTQ